MSSRLDFLVIGAQKCATSWMYYCLKDHPDLILPAKKPEITFLGGDLYEKKGAKWYFELLGEAAPHQKTGDVSIEYIYDARAPKAVNKHAPGTKFIVSLREPVDRAISAYYWEVRKGAIPDLPLEDGLGRAMDGNAESDGESMGKDPYTDIIRRGFYDTQIERYLKYFRLDQFLFVLFEDIQEEALRVIQKIYDFIGVDPSFVPSSYGASPKRNLYLGPLIHFERFFSKSKLAAKLSDITNNGLYRIGVRPQRPRLTDALEKKLQQLYLPHIKKTQKIIQKAPVAQQPFSDMISVWNGKWR